MSTQKILFTAVCLFVFAAISLQAQQPAEENKYGFRIAKYKGDSKLLKSCN